MAIADRKAKEKEDLKALILKGAKKLFVEKGVNKQPFGVLLRALITVSELSTSILKIKMPSCMNYIPRAFHN